MEFIIIMISVPLFLIIVLLLSVFVLANYSGNEPTKGSPAEVRVADKTGSEDNVKVPKHEYPESKQ
jgi:hypothetical protein